MINFTGQTKKRIVNLGDRKPERTSRNYLEHTRLLRQQREEQRLKERSAIVLQKYIRRRLDLLQACLLMQLKWRNEFNNWKDTDAWEMWLSEAIFIFKWLAKQGSDLDQSQNLELFKRALLVNNKYNIAQNRMSSIVKCLGCNLKTVERNLNMAFLVNTTIEIFNLLLDRFAMSQDNSFLNIIPVLSRIIMFQNSDINRKEVMDFIFKINTKDSYQNFVKFLCIPDIFDSNNDYLYLLRNILNNESIGELSEREKVNLLINYLRIHDDNDFLLQDYLILEVILSNIAFSILEYDDIDLEDEDIDMNVDRDIAVQSKKVVLVRKTILDELEVLCSSRFLKGITDLLREKQTTSGVLRSVHVILSTLIHLLPSLKSRICVLLTVSPGIYRLIFDTLKDSPIYDQFLALSNLQDYLTSENLASIKNSAIGKNLPNFWESLYTFEEVFSYWLIVCNDFELFSDDKLTQDETVEFLQFLKCLCLTLIFNDSKHFNEDYSKLKEISLTLLNQLYTRNLRMKFLGDNFWQPKSLDFNIDGMLQVIAEEEERRVEAGDDSDDESNETKKMRILNSETKAKLDILKKLPFFISFKDRVKVFHTLIELDRQRLMPRNGFYLFQSKLKADIRREHLLEDAYVNFHKSGRDFKHPLQVVFYNDYGVEAGIDGGGITKEFLTSVVTEGFSSNLFKETDDHQIYPNRDIFLCLSKKIDLSQQQEKLSYLRFLGNVVGKCFYENVLIDISFAPFFLNKWCSDLMKNSINDLKYLDKELYVNLMKLTNMSPEELESLELTFNVDQMINGKNYTFDLIPNGSKIKVDPSNKLNYIHQLSNFKLNQSLHIQTKYFLSGLYEIISSTWLSMFDSHELQMLISGGTSDVDIGDWKENVEYHGFFESDVTIVHFWEVVAEMTAEERFKLIKFVTSVSRAPLLGFGSLAPRFGIRNSGSDRDRLPTASTCVNLLKLPDYKDKELIRSKLLYAINTGAGFDLS